MTAGESGWDVFMLGYFVSMPLTSVITEKQIEQYRKLFRLLWALRGVDYGLKDLWKQRLALDLGSLAEMRGAWHAVSLLHMEMTHLLNELQYYLIFEVRLRNALGGWGVGRGWGWGVGVGGEVGGWVGLGDGGLIVAIHFAMDHSPQVIECSWDELLLAIKEDVRDFDGLIAAHATFVNSLMVRAFLDAVSKVRRCGRQTHVSRVA